MSLRRLFWVVAVFFVLNQPHADAGILSECKVKLAAIVGEKLTHRQEWKLTAEQEKAIGEEMSRTDRTDQEKLETLYTCLVSYRIENANPVTGFFVRGTARTLNNQRSVYAWTLGGLLTLLFGPHYNPIFMSLIMLTIEIQILLSGS